MKRNPLKYAGSYGINRLILVAIFVFLISFVYSQNRIENIRIKKEIRCKFKKAGWGKNMTSIKKIKYKDYPYEGYANVFNDLWCYRLKLKGYDDMYLLFDFDFHLVDIIIFDDAPNEVFELKFFLWNERDEFCVNLT